MNTKKKVVTRMAPSPTGRFHVGGIRTAFYNYAFARKHKGTFILRIEDTDTGRNKKEYEDEIYEVFSWIGMDYDKVFRQSEHLTRHQEILKKLIDDGFAYEAEMSKDGNGKVIRFKNPNKTIVFQDEILGEIKVDTSDLGDFVIARNTESPLYHLAVVVDDHDEGVTHIIRAQEHVANTPRQILIHEALGFNPPVYAHVPFILGPDGKKKLSKRDTNVAAMDYKKNGFLPEALLNFLVFIGWNPGTEQEIFTKEELIHTFSLEQVQKSPGGFNLDKLAWLNKQWLQKMTDEDFFVYLKSALGDYMQHDFYREEMMQKLIPILRERIHSYIDLHTMIEQGDLDYFFTAPTLVREKIIWKKDSKEGGITHLKKIFELLSEYSDDFTQEAVKEVLWSYAEEQGKGNVLWPLRYVLSGKEKSPDPFILLEILGKDESFERIRKGIVVLEDK